MGNMYGEMSHSEPDLYTSVFADLVWDRWLDNVLEDSTQLRIWFMKKTTQ